MKAKRILLLILPALFAVALVVATAIPGAREKIQAYFSLVGQDVLATAEGDVFNDGTNGKVVKYRNREGIYVEVLRVDNKGILTTVDRVLLPDKHDGLFNYQGRVTRLAIADIDNDGKLELLAPTFDNQLVPHLNVFRYNPAIGRLEFYQPPNKP